MTSGLVAECLDALSMLAKLNEVTFAWVPGHRGIPGNEEADTLARQASAMPLLGPEPALGILKCSVREALITGLRCSIIQPRKICQVSYMANYFEADYVRKELTTYLS